jgi:hypothetical protein
MKTTRSLLTESIHTVQRPRRITLFAGALSNAHLPAIVPTNFLTSKKPPQSLKDIGFTKWMSGLY